METIPKPGERVEYRNGDKKCTVKVIPHFPSYCDFDIDEGEFFTVPVFVVVKLIDMIPNWWDWNDSELFVTELNKLKYL